MPNPLRSTFAGDPEMADLVSLFVEEMPARIESLRNAMSEGRVEAVRRIAHQLKGSSAGYGFAPIGDAAGRLEELTKGAADLERIAREVDSLVSMCGRVIA